MPFTPLHSLLGGLSLSCSLQGLLYLNGQVLGVSGFLHRAVSATIGVRGATWDDERSSLALAFVAGLVGAGFVIERAEESIVKGLGVQIFDPALRGFGGGDRFQAIAWVIGSGLLVGFGTKLGSGCTSGHFLCGLSRLSKRSFAATATFFSVAVLAANVLGTVPFLAARGASSAVKTQIAEATWELPDWTVVALLQLPVLGYAIIAPLLAKWEKSRAAKSAHNQDETKGREKKASSTGPVSIVPRLITSCLAGAHFATGLTLTGMLHPSKVLGFLAFPLPPLEYLRPPSSSFSPFLSSAVSSATRVWDPSLSLVALGGILPALFTYQYHLLPFLRKALAPTPKLGGSWNLPNPLSPIDAKLIIGAVIFGLGWGASGLCPGPALVYMGATLGGRTEEVGRMALFVGSMAVGGQLAW